MENELTLAMNIKQLLSKSGVLLVIKNNKRTVHGDSRCENNR